MEVTKYTVFLGKTDKMFSSTYMFPGLHRCKCAVMGFAPFAELGHAVLDSLPSHLTRLLSAPDHREEKGWLGETWQNRQDDLLTSLAADISSSVLDSWEPSHCGKPLTRLPTGFLLSGLTAGTSQENRHRIRLTPVSVICIYTHGSLYCLWQIFNSKYKF